MSQPVVMNGGSTTGTGVPMPVPEPAVPSPVQVQVPQGVPGVPGVPLGIPHAVPVPHGLPPGVPHGVPHGLPHPGHPVHTGMLSNPHAQLNGGSKTGIGVKRVPPPVRTVSLPGAGKSPAAMPPELLDSSDCESARGRCTPVGFCLDVLKNLGVCLLVVLYLLLGAFVFLAMNDDLWDPMVIPVVSGPSAGTNNVSVPGLGAGNSGQPPTSLQLAIQEQRTRTIERIWEITVNLNILYRDNWTELAGREIERFQQQLMARIAEEELLEQQLRQSRRERRADPGPGGGLLTVPLPLSAPPSVPGLGLGPGPGPGPGLGSHKPRIRVFHHHSVRWNFAQAFLFSLTVISTIGYGSFTPLTPVGKAVTMVYAALGIPLMLLYLSAVGGLLARCARGVFTRAVCCCLCSKCGYCCYDEDRMQEKERRLRRKREELQLKMNSAPYYVRSADPPAYRLEVPRLPTRPFSGSVLAPVLLCGSIMMVYVMGGAVALWGLRAFQFLDCVFFCFMSLTTIGFGNLIPGASLHRPHDMDLILWFCSGYILIGMALTTMCCNVVYSVLLHAIRHATAVARATRTVASKH